MVRNLLFNTVIQHSLKKDYSFYSKNRKRQKGIQEQILKTIIEKNKKTEFGKKHGFSSISDIISYKKAVCITDYSAYASYVSAMQEKKNNLLTEEPVLLLEPTSGTENGTKLIPYTGSLKKEFLRAINVWLYDLYHHFPRIKKGTCYWSISPAIQDQKKYQGTIPIGFEDDSDYLDRKGRLIRTLYAVPPQVKHLTSYRNFRYVTAYFLLLAKDLALVSVWNPSFFLLIIDCIVTNYESLIRDIHDGVLHLPEPEESGYLTPFIRKNTSRAKELAGTGIPEPEIRFQKIWKELSLISCWTESYSTYHSNRLKDYFPGVHIQGKGLLATEGVVSFPLVESGGCLPAYTSHFMEFKPDDSEETVPLWELEKGSSYTVIITTGGGLYRYNLADRINVTDFYEDIPLLRFSGRQRIIDTVGEKLDEEIVSQYIDFLFAAKNIKTSFLLITPELSDCSVCYSLYVELRQKIQQQSLTGIAEQIDLFLEKNYHYHYARKLGQITPFQIVQVKDARKTYMERCMKDGMRLGDIKHVFFDVRPDWKKFFIPVREKEGA
ncbi:MAG: GH3 auxin-responsive promoter family protein [Spirochaetales bacterium]|nr:GH3 auxin-responsive promoter family protein [Spirochaetales bacterium]